VFALGFLLAVVLVFAAPAAGAAATSDRAGSLDTVGRPYAVVDKLRAQISVHHADGRLAGRSAVLLGAAPGDLSLPGVGERAEAGRLRAQDKTTPAGRFRAERGRNLQGDAVLWLDYDAAFAIHRLRPGPSAMRRAQALAQADAQQRRLSDGCVVVPGAFFDRVVLPLLGGGDALVVVLPETETMTRRDEMR
jgi:hypothetical protein